MVLRNIQRLRHETPCPVSAAGTDGGRSAQQRLLHPPHTLHDLSWQTHSNNYDWPELQDALHL